MPSIEQPSFPGNPHDSPAPSISVILRGSSKECIVEKYVSTVISLYQRLLQFPNLDPTPELSDVFQRLVAVCIETPAEVITEMVLPTVFLFFPRELQLILVFLRSLQIHALSRLLLISDNYVPKENAGLRRTGQRKSDGLKPKLKVSFLPALTTSALSTPSCAYGQWLDSEFEPS